jgi:serine/threonine-protein kinase HipA
VYLGPERVGEIERQGPTRYRYRYAQDTVAEHSEGTLVLSASLPTRSTWCPNGETKPFFEGLLPEGSIRTTLARSLGLSADNGFGLLAELGADCAGAVVVVPPGSDAPRESEPEVEWLSEDGLAQLIADLPRNPLGIDVAEGAVRLSIAGVQPKLLLNRAPTGQLGQPRVGTPSTYLLKPGQEQFPDLPANEAFCLRVAQASGLRAARAEVVIIGGLECLLVERWDRSVVEGHVRRIHQEDFCQALGLLPAAKYEIEGGPSVAAMVDLLRRIGGPTLARDLVELVRTVALNVLLGNCDAHGKNYALLYESLGIPRLAPLYDVLCTVVYSGLTQELAMSVGGVRDPADVDAAAWRRLAAETGLGAQVPRAVAAFAERAVAAARAARDESVGEGWHRPTIDRIVEGVERRATQMT